MQNDKWNFIERNRNKEHFVFNSSQQALNKSLNTNKNFAAEPSNILKDIVRNLVKNPIPGLRTYYVLKALWYKPINIWVLIMLNHS